MLTALALPGDARQSAKTRAALNDAYRLAKQHANVSLNFADDLTWFWYEAALERCADYVGWLIGERDVAEVVEIKPDGLIRLSLQPSSDVEFWSGPSRIAVEPATGRYVKATSILCCQCCLSARYTAGIDVCELPASFLMGVARLFVYIAENRGEVEMDENVLGRSGAKSFLVPYTTFVA